MNELLKMTAHQIKEGKFDKVILAIGSCEAHGQHLAEGCDTIVSYELSKQVADRVPGMLVLPPITVGYSGHYDTFPFTLTFDYETMIHVIYDIVESVLRNGINKIFLMNGHDGNIAPIEIAARKIKEKYPDARIASCRNGGSSPESLSRKEPSRSGTDLDMRERANPPSLTIYSRSGVSRIRQPASCQIIFRNMSISSGISLRSQIQPRPVTRPSRQRKKESS